MSFLYNITIRTFGLVIRSAAPFNDKAKKWLHGRKDLFSELENEFAGSEKKTGRILMIVVLPAPLRSQNLIFLTLNQQIKKELQKLQK